jgi:hypothetical protein
MTSQHNRFSTEKFSGTRGSLAILGPVDKGDSQKGQYLIQGSFWGGYLDPGFDERRGVGLP